MKETIYKSRIGNIIIKNNVKHYTAYSKQLEARSLNQDNEDFLIEKYTQLLTNPDNIQMFAESKVWPACAVKDFIRNEIKRWNSGEKLSVFSIYNNENKEFIGYLHIKHSLADFSRVGAGHPNVGEIIYIIDKAAWGKGFGTQIACLGEYLIQHIVSASARGTLQANIKEIVATVHPSNEGSLRILKKTLGQSEPQQIQKFGGQPRLLFFKPLQVATGELDQPRLRSSL